MVPASMPMDDDAEPLPGICQKLRYTVEYPVWLDAGLVA
jgi:hypothetical protein